MKRGICVSDLHCGSIYGLLPPSFETFEGVLRLPNPGQEYLWRCWDDFTNRAGRFSPDFIIVNGDLLDGMQQKNKGSELALNAPFDQSRAAVETLRLLKARVPA